MLLKLGAPRPALRDKFVSYHVRLFGEWFEASRRSIVEDSRVGLEAGASQLAQGFLPMLLRTAKVSQVLYCCLANFLLCSGRVCVRQL
jgi:hypothetical protein